MGSDYKESVEVYRHQCITAAKDFYYGREVLDKLKAAKTEAELVRIMQNARHDKFK